MHVPVPQWLSYAPRAKLAQRLAVHRSTHIMVNYQHLAEKVKDVSIDKVAPLPGDQAAPLLLPVPAVDVIVLSIKLDLILVHPFEQLICAQYLRDLDQLIRVVVPSTKERLLTEDDRCNYASYRPDVRRQVIPSIADEVFRSSPKPGPDTACVRIVGIVIVREAPIDQAKLCTIKSAFLP